MTAPVSINLYDYLARSSCSHPDQIAVVDPTGRQLTYRELHKLAQNIAGFLAARGVQCGDRVGIIGAKSIEVVGALFGVMAAGAAYVPADYTAPASRNRTVLSDCNVKVVFLDTGCASILEGWPNRGPPEVVWFTGADRELLPTSGTPWAVAATHTPSNHNRHASETGLAYILYTSGSTGQPKGVAISHENAISFVEWCSDEFQPVATDRFSNHAPFHFDLSVFDLYVSIKHGATLYIVSDAVAKSPGQLAEFIESNRVTIWYSTPSTLSLLAQFGKLESRDCTALRIVLFAGEVFPIKHLRTIIRHWPQAAFYNLYGPTETNVCTFAKIPATIPLDRREPFPIGHLCSHCFGLVLETPGGRKMPRGEEGLLHIAGSSVFQGYWNRPDHSLFFDRDGLRYYNTGDVVRETASDGYIYVGRRDRMVKRRGYRIELAEIERGLYQNDKVREAAAISVPDPASGVRIIAYISPSPGELPTIVELKSFCGRALPNYMNPDVFVVLDALPQTSTGKIDYQCLVQMSVRVNS